MSSRSIAYLAATLRVSRSTIKRGNTELEAVGYIVRYEDNRRPNPQRAPKLTRPTMPRPTTSSLIITDGPISADLRY